MLKVLITGASGFIGKNLSEYLFGKYELFLPAHKDLDLLKGEAVKDYLQANNFDVVVHCAAVGISRKNNTAEAAVINLRMFANLAKFNRLYGKMIVLGSGAEYDKRRDLVKIKEEDFGENIPEDYYGFYKYLCSLLIENIPNIINLRTFAVFGKYEDYETRFISNAICRSLYGLPITINQNVKFDYFDVSDLVKIIEYFIQNISKHKYYNVGSGQSITLVEIVKKLEVVCGKELSVTVKALGLNKEYTCDSSRLRDEIPTVSFLNFDQSLSELYTWYKENQHMIDKNKLGFD